MTRFENLHTLVSTTAHLKAYFVEAQALGGNCDIFVYALSPEEAAQASVEYHKLTDPADIEAGFKVSELLPPCTGPDDVRRDDGVSITHVDPFTLTYRESADQDDEDEGSTIAIATPIDGQRSDTGECITALGKESDASMQELNNTTQPVHEDHHEAGRNEQVCESDGRDPEFARSRGSVIGLATIPTRSSTTLSGLMGRMHQHVRDFFQTASADDMWPLRLIAKTASGLVWLECPDFDAAYRDLYFAELRRQLCKLGAECYVIASEAWMGDVKSPIAPSQQADRREAMVLCGADVQGRTNGLILGMVRDNSGRVIELVPVEEASEEMSGTLLELLR